jgi:subtilisin-like proprotein convertase family protein
MKKMCPEFKNCVSKISSFVLLLLIPLSLTINPVAVTANRAAGEKTKTPKLSKPILADTTTTASNATPIAIPDNPTTGTPYPSNITIAGTVGTITNVTVVLRGITTQRPRDMEVLLVAPGGQKLLLISDTAGVLAGANTVNVTLTLQDGSPPLPDDVTGNTPWVTGTFRPTNNTAGEAAIFPAPAPNLTTANYPPNNPAGTVCTGCTATFASIFAQPGVAANGVWSLYVFDDAGGGTASTFAQGWTLNVTTNNIPATAASVGISGRVVTPKGIGVPGVRVLITGANGDTHTVLTDEFGNYHFEDAEAGQTYIFSASHKRYHFTQPTQVVFVTEDLTDINFVALPYKKFS